MSVLAYLEQGVMMVMVMRGPAGPKAAKESEILGAAGYTLMHA